MRLLPNHKISLPSRYLLALMLIVVGGLLVRTINLHTIPPGISQDEVSAVYNGYSLLRTGRDIGGQPWYSAVFRQPLGYSQPELHAFFAAPGWLLHLPALVSARLPFALLSTISIVLIYTLVLILTKRHSTALLSAVMLAISPWHIIVSRTAFEMPTALTLLFAALILLAKPRYLWLSILLFAASALMYHGMKFVILPLIFLFGWYWGKTSGKRLSIAIVFISLCVMLAAYLPVFMQINSSKGRVQELLFVNPGRFSSEIDFFRSQSLSSPRLTNLFVNKGTYVLRRGFENFVGFFSTDMLFLAGEGNPLLSVWYHGLAYPIEFFIIPIGLYALYRRNRRLWILTIGFLVIGLIPSLLSSVGRSYTLRSLTALPPIILWTAYGIEALTEFLRRKKVPFGNVGLGVLYGLSFLSFFVLYQTRFPVFAAPGFFMGDRIIAAYIQKIPSDQSVYIRTPEPEKHFLQYAFYTRLDPRMVARAWQDQVYTAGNVTFSGNCPQGAVDTFITHKDREICPTVASPTFITDATNIWHIWQDSLCENSTPPPSRFSFPTTLGDFSSLESIPTEALCTTWFKMEKSQ